MKTIFTNSIKYFIALVLIVFLYSGLIKWVNFGVDPTFVSFILLIIIFLIKLKSKIRFAGTEIKILLVFGVLYSLTSVYTLSESYYLEKILYLWLAIFSFILPSVIFNKNDDLIVFFKLLKIILVCSILFLLYLFFSGQWSLFIVKQENSLNIPNYLAVASFIVVFVIYNLNKVSKFNVIFSLLALMMMILLSGRGPVIGLFIVYFAYILSKNKSKLRIVAKLLPLIILIITALYFFSDNIELISSMNRFSSLGLDNERSSQFLGSLDVIKDNLFFGVGIGGYGIASAGLDEFWHPHNIILEILSESGIFISSIFVFLLVKIFIINRINIKLNDDVLIISSIALYHLTQTMKSGGIPDMRVTFFWFGLMTYYFKKNILNN